MRIIGINTQLLTAVAAAVIGLAIGQAAYAQAEKAPQAKPDDAHKFQGKVEAVDSDAKTLTIGGNLLYVTEATKLTKNDKTILLTAIRVGDMVHGTSRPTSDGKTEAITIVVGAPAKDRDKQPK